MKMVHHNLLLMLLLQSCSNLDFIIQTMQVLVKWSVAFPGILFILFYFIWALWGACKVADLGILLKIFRNNLFTLSLRKFLEYNAKKFSEILYHAALGFLSPQ